MSRTLAGSFFHGTSIENFAAFESCSSCLSRQFDEPGFQSAIAPSLIESVGSGTSRSGSTRGTAPRPEQPGHAPYGELNEKRRGVISGSDVPQSGQAYDVESVSSEVDAPFPSTT